jgi:hypothetical protein
LPRPTVGHGQSLAVGDGGPGAGGARARHHADKIIAEREAREQRACQMHAIEAQALKDIDAASGAAIEQLVRQAFASIEAVSKP